MHETDLITVLVNGESRRAAIEREDPRILELLRARTCRERAEMANQLCHAARRGAEAAIRRQHPHWTDQQVSAELIWRYQGVRV